MISKKIVNLISNISDEKIQQELTAEFNESKNKFAEILITNLEKSTPDYAFYLLTQARINESKEFVDSLENFDKKTSLLNCIVSVQAKLNEYNAKEEN